MDIREIPPLLSNEEEKHISDYVNKHIPSYIRQPSTTLIIAFWKNLKKGIPEEPAAQQALQTLRRMWMKKDLDYPELAHILKIFRGQGGYTKSICFAQFGGPEILFNECWEEFEKIPMPVLSLEVAIVCLYLIAAPIVNDKDSPYHIPELIERYNAGFFEKRR